MTDLGTLPGGKNSTAVAINERGRVIGSSGSASGWGHAVVWEHGRMTDLGTLPGGKSSFAAALNNHNQIVGYSTTKTGKKHAVLWTLRNG